MNPITPLVKTGLLLALGTTAIVAVAVTHHAAPAVVAPPRVVAHEATPSRAGAMSATGTAGKPTAAHQANVPDDDEVPELIITSVDGNVELDDAKRAQLAQCFIGPDTRGRIDFQVEVTGKDTTRQITSASPLAGDRENAGLHRPAVERCAMDALADGRIEVAATFPASQRITVIAAEGAHCHDEVTAPNTHVKEDGLAGLPSLGPVDAPVTLVEYNDFQCPFCAQLAKTVAGLTKRYPTQLRVVFRNAPLPVHAHAAPAAKAALAAHQQGRFWPMRDLLFAN